MIHPPMQGLHPDVPCDVRLTPRQCFALKFLLEDARTFDALEGALVVQGVVEDAAEDAAEQVAAELARAPYRAAGTTAPVGKAHTRIVTAHGVNVDGRHYNHAGLWSLVGQAVRVRVVRDLAGVHCAHVSTVETDRWLCLAFSAEDTLADVIPADGPTADGRRAA